MAFFFICCRPFRREVKKKPSCCVTCSVGRQTPISSWRFGMHSSFVGCLRSRKKFEQGRPGFHRGHQVAREGRKRLTGVHILMAKRGLTVVPDARNRAAACEPGPTYTRPALEHNWHVAFPLAGNVRRPLEQSHGLSKRHW